MKEGLIAGSVMVVIAVIVAYAVNRRMTRPWRRIA